jgi:hypothetical protein
LHYRTSLPSLQPVAKCNRSRENAMVERSVAHATFVIEGIDNLGEALRSAKP